MTTLAFAKWEGLGNDFIVVDGEPGRFDEATVRALCDRHRGVGADGVLVVGEARSAGAAGTMTVLNADGSRPEMCGNGLRCVARHLAARGAPQSFVVDTDAGPRGCEVRGDEVAIDMGVCEDLGFVELAAEAAAYRLRRVLTGNPHAITFAPVSEARIDADGPWLSRHPLFVRGTNVEFARLADDGGIDVVVWERGVGRTLACGTGACATLAAACLDGARPFDAEVQVRLPGGPLAVRIARATMRATMRGPARLAFRGTVELGEGPARRAASS
jgi:diaminopimelate epimerase